MYVVYFGDLSTDNILLKLKIPICISQGEIGGNGVTFQENLPKRTVFSWNHQLSLNPQAWSFECVHSGEWHSAQRMTKASWMNSVFERDVGKKFCKEEFSFTGIQLESTERRDDIQRTGTGECREAPGRVTWIFSRL
ncbi:uncharacterized protein ACOB8E_001544 isoform 1-T2 [Sarcophilus harrisii]